MKYQQPEIYCKSPHSFTLFQSLDSTEFMATVIFNVNFSCFPLLPLLELNGWKRSHSRKDNNEYCVLVHLPASFLARVQLPRTTKLSLSSYFKTRQTVERWAQTTTCKLTFPRAVFWTDSTVEVFLKYVRPDELLRLLKTSAETRPPTQNQSAGPGTHFIAWILPGALAGLLPGTDHLGPARPGSAHRQETSWWNPTPTRLFSLSLANKHFF